MNSKEYKRWLIYFIIILSVPTVLVLSFVLFHIVKIFLGTEPSVVSSVLLQGVSFFTVIYIGLSFFPEEVEYGSILKTGVPINLKQIFLGGVIGFSMSIILGELDSYLQYLFPVEREEELLWQEILFSESKAGQFLNIIIIAGVAPLIEEFFFRGFLLSLLSQVISWRGAILISALIFAIVHQPPRIIIPVFFAGLTLAYLVLKLNSIWIGVVVHGAFNFIPFLGVLLGKGEYTPAGPSLNNGEPAHIPIPILLIAILVFVASIYYLTRGRA